MGFLLALTCVLILYGTLYPFSFDFGLHGEGVFALLMASAQERASRGDILANVILFLPFGFFAMQRILPRAPKPARLFFVVVAGAMFSFGIEWAQTGLPGRVTSVYDLATNTAGSLLGAVLGWHDWRQKLSGLRPGKRPPALFPLLLLGAWLGGRLFPFVPTLDVQNVKDALKPLFYAGFSPLDALRDFIITMVVCRLVRALTAPGNIRTAATLLPLAVIAVKPFIEGGIIPQIEGWVISQAGIVGTLLGIAVWWGIVGRMRRNAVILVLLLMTQIVIQGLEPFVFSPRPASLFSVIPFIGFIQGSMIANVMSFIEKIFFYGSLLWLLVKASDNLSFSLLCSVALLTVLEFMQMFLPGRASEITDPLLVAILGLVLHFLDLRGNQQCRSD